MPTILTNKTSLLVNKILRPALLAFLAGLILGAVGDILLQGAFHTVFPCVDVLIVEVEAFDEVEDVHDGHSVADDP